MREALATELTARQAADDERSVVVHVKSDHPARWDYVRP